MPYYWFVSSPKHMRLGGGATLVWGLQIIPGFGVLDSSTMGHSGIQAPRKNTIHKYNEKS